MKKMSLILAVLMLTGFSFAIDEFNDNSGSLMFDLVKDEANLIEVDTMKKSDQVEKAIKKDTQAPVIQMNKKAIKQQRALNFSTIQTNSMRLPL